MTRRISKRYTILITCTGKGPVTLAFDPKIMLALLFGGVAIAAAPFLWMSGVVHSYSQNNHRLKEHNHQLTKEAKDILTKVEALESEIDTLQQRAGISQNAPVQNAPVQKQSYQEDRFQPQGGGIPVDADDLLRAARSQLPELLESLQGEVKPALEKTLVKENARPQGSPVKGFVELSSGFGLRSDPFGGGGMEFHEGLDFIAAYGTPIHVTAPGYVVEAGWSQGGYGNYVIVDHGYGFQTLYAHLSAVAVEKGMKLERDRIIGYLGNTGRSSGPHLHYSVYINDRPIDPERFLDPVRATRSSFEEMLSR
jgi:murein DD-endopeptidase MepM/ murein hydrolase activator NlpD